MTRRIGRFHVITDTQLQQRWTHLDVARLAVEGGADVVQFRDKRTTATTQLVRRAMAIARLIPEHVQLIVDDRVDVAVAAGAHGVHLGRDDLDIDSARRLAPHAIIGGTANSIDEARQRARQPLDYIGAGPVFGTRSKASPAAPLGLEALAAIVQVVDCPVIAIGDITPQRVPEVLDSGAHGFAVLSGVTCRDDPADSAARYREALDAHIAATRSET